MTLEVFTGSGVRVFVGTEDEVYQWLQTYPQYLIPEWYIPFGSGRGNRNGSKDSVVLFYWMRKRLEQEATRDANERSMFARALKASESVDEVPGDRAHTVMIAGILNEVISLGLTGDERRHIDVDAHVSRIESLFDTKPVDPVDMQEYNRRIIAILGVLVSDARNTSLHTGARTLVNTAFEQIQRANSNKGQS